MKRPKKKAITMAIAALVLGNNSDAAQAAIADMQHEFTKNQKQASLYSEVDGGIVCYTWDPSDGMVA